jgi:hypothetical protein
MATRPNVSAGRPGGGKATGSSAWGRGRLTLALLGFLLLGIGVISRRTYGTRQGIVIEKLKVQRSSLLGAETQVSDEIREASSRRRLGPIVEQRLNMHVPKPEQLISLPRPIMPTPRGGR